VNDHPGGTSARDNRDGFRTIKVKTMEGLRPSFSAQVRSHGKPGQVGEPGAPVQLGGTATDSLII
jgi:hypothetical protein